MKTLYEAANGLEVHMLADVLKQEGIRAQVMGSYLPGALGELPAAGLVRLLVEDEDFEPARSVIERWEATQAPEPAKAGGVAERRGAPWSWGLGGLVLGAGLCVAVLRVPVQEDGIDHNRDGVLDERWEYSLSGVAVGAEVDRNFDSRTDLRLRYNVAGELDVEERDDDFNGSFETRTTYRMNQAQRTEADTDGDGMVDSVTHFMHGVASRLEYLDPRSGAPHRIEHLRLGRLDQVERDTDGDGVPDLREHYNALGQITRTERIEAP